MIGELYDGEFYNMARQGRLDALVYDEQLCNDDETTGNGQEAQNEGEKMDKYITVLEAYIDHLENTKKNAGDWFNKEQANKDIEAFKASIEALKQNSKIDKVKAEIEANIGDNPNQDEGLYRALQIIDRIFASRNTDTEKNIKKH